MEKNKNRTDLLAAGRKKLQQFRQKKDNKGNNSKPSKGGKSGRDKTAAAVDEATVNQQNVPADELSKHDRSDTVDNSESSSGMDAEASETATGNSKQDLSVGTSNDIAIGQQHDADEDRFQHDAEDTNALPQSISRVDTVESDAASELDSVTSDSAVANKDPSAKGKVGIACLLEVAGFPSEGSGMDNTSDGHDVDIRASKEDGSSSTVLEDTTINVPAMVSEERSGDSNLLLPTDSSSELEREHGEEQVTDVGAMQEVGSSGGNQIDDRVVNLLDGDTNPPSDDTRESVADSRAADSGNMYVEENISAATQLSQTDNASLAVSVTNYAGEGEEARDHTVGTSPLTESSMLSTIRSVPMGQESDGTSFGSNEGKTEAVNVSDTEGTQASSGFVEVERSYEVENRDNANFLASKQLDLSSILDGSVIKLSQLAEILQVLDQDEFRYLFMSRESSLEKSRNADNMDANDYVVRDAFERLKEHLYTTSLSKDACYLQLSEHQKWIDEIAVNSSLVEVQEKNETFAKEILQCRNELQEVVSVRVQLEKELQLSRAEAEVFAAKVDELQNKLELTQGEMSSISSELVDCRNLVQALQSENEYLNGSFKVMTEEKNKLSQECRSFLLENEKITEELNQHKASLESLETLMQDDRKRLEQENYGMISENSKLLADLAECKNTVEVLTVENKNLNGILTSLSEEQKKLDEEKVSMDHQIGKMSEESINCKELILTLQAEIINLNEHITSIVGEKSKLEEEQKTIFREYEKQYLELVEFKVLEGVLQAECCKAVNDLKEARTCIKHHTAENKSLYADLEFHKLKKNSSQFDTVASEGVKDDSGVLQEPKSSRSSREQRKLGIYDDPFGFLALKRNLEEAGVVTQKLEREIESMHLNTSSLNRSTDDVPPGVSRLIQNFELKGYTETDDQDPDESLSSEGHTTEDSYMRTKLVTQNLKVLLKELVNDADDASEFCRVMQSKLLANAAGTDLSKHSILKEHDDEVQEANIELMVLYEAMKELIHQAVAKESELLGLCDAMQKQEAVLKSENHHLQEKMNDFQAHINELQVHLEGHCRDSDEMAAFISNQLQALQAEVADREWILQEEQSSVSAQILHTVGMLDSTAKNISANSLPGRNNSHDVVGSVAASVDGACKVIEGLHGQLEASQRGFHEMSHKTDVALSILHRLYSELSGLVRATSGYYPDAAENVLADDKNPDLLDPNFFDVLLDQLKKLSSERFELEFANKQLSSQMTSTAKETDELQKLCLKSDTVLKLIDEIEQLVKLEGPAMHVDEPASLLESLIHLLVHKYRETGHASSLAAAALEMQVHDLQGEVERLNFVLMEYGNENLVFKHSLKSAEEVVIALNSKVQEKVAELEQSEQRISSLREKLGIAVTKGKGLISQRETLKQSLAEASKEWEKCSQELLSKDARLQELETKVKVYSEAGERMEALESELSYIRNSATALRESFLLKDSVLQRLEEVLEDVELLENFHSSDIIEKIEWLAKIVGNHTLPPGEWDHRSSPGEGSYSDAGYVGMDGLKEDVQPTPTSSEDLRRGYEELQNRFYGLAEQNEMLEQSLMERNNLVQRWEEILNRVDMPSQLRSVEPDDKIQWLGSALSEAQSHSYSLQQKIDNLESFCESLSADVEDSQRRASELEEALHQACAEKEILSKDLEIMRQDNDESIKRIADFTLRNENLQNESSLLQTQKLRLEEDKDRIEDAIRRLKEVVKDGLQDSFPEDVVLDHEGVEDFEEMLRKLVEKHKALLSGKLVDVDSTDVHATGEGELSHTSRDLEEQDFATKKLDESLGELMCLKEEKDRYMQTNQSLIRELEELEVKKKELEEQLNQEERKSASLREKLNVAVRKGKSLVQQRDGMKQSIEELNAEVERLKSESKHTEQTIYEHEEQIKNLLSARDRVQVVESENSFLRDRLGEIERYLQEKEGSWSSILTALGEIDAGLEINSGAPVERIREIGKYLQDLHGRMDSLEQESRKSRRAAELLLAELNEVQERNDGLQDEVAKVVDELSEVSREKDLAENAKQEAIAHVEKLSFFHSEEKERHMSEITVLKSGVDTMRNALSAIDRELGDVLAKDLEVLYNVKATMKSFFDLDGIPALGALFPVNLPGGIFSAKSENKVSMAQIDSLRQRIHEHLSLLQEESSQLSEVVMNVHREYTSEKEFYESVKRDAERLQSIDKEKESKLHILQGNISLLFESCASAISRLENWKEHVAENVLASRSPQRNLNSQNQLGGNISFGDARIFNEESIRSMCDKLSLVLGDSINMHTIELARVMEVGQGEMKSTIMNLQNELQEKDIQRERICKELVDQIKEAETNANNHLLDLQQARAKLNDSQRQLDVMGEERKLLEQRLNELQDREINAKDLHQKVNSLTDALAAKVQECEGLMQALDEEEAEMETLANKIVGLENDLQRKNKDLENLEASRAKALKKLSVTVSKFDELHFLSENLLSEVEKLQSQLQEKDGEISFLRQEVTRCTNDALAVTQMSKKSSDEIQDLLAWLDSSISLVQANDVTIDYSNHLVDEHKKALQKKILDLISELENHRATTQNRDMLLQEERIKVDELTQKEQHLKNSLREMESQLVALGVGDSDNATKSTSEIVEVEPTTNKWTSGGSVAPQVRSLRKPNNDQVAIAIDVDNSSQSMEDDDDDKAHGFKSLTTSKIVPRFTRPVSNVVDGLWMSCDRALMRQPALRLGVILYWALLHAMLATFVV